MRSILGFAIGVLATAATIAFVYLVVFEALPGERVGADEVAIWVITGLAGAVSAALWVVTVVVLRRAGTG